MSKERRAMLQMFFCGVFWSLSGVLIKLIPWNALVIGAARSLLTAAVVLVYMRVRGLRPRFNRRVFFLGVAAVAVGVCYLPAIKLTTAANAIVLQYTAPVYVLLFSALLFKQRIRRGDAIAVALTIAGIALFFFDQMGEGTLLGNLLALASGVFYSFMFMLSGNVDEETRLSGLLLAQLMMTCIGLPLAFVYDTPVNQTILLFVLVLGIVQLGVPTILFNLAAKHCPPLTCSIISVVEPLLNPVWVFLVMGERPSVFALIGGVLVLITVTIWCVWGEKQKAANAAAAASAVTDAAAPAAMNNE